MTDADLDYQRELDRLTSAVERLAPRQRLGWLLAAISPLLDQVAARDGDLYDEQEMTTPEAVERFRRYAGGGTRLDPAPIHYHLTYFSLVESEDQDVRMHVRSQAAWLAAQWLQLETGRELPAVEDDFELRPTADIANTLAWTRSGQIELLPEDAAHGDAGAAVRELRLMRDELAGWPEA
ncbi:hypothetical protein [Hamadaea tsunoensis]|uniref:hypothetical protein n=1 Tax=Hamadaea tsunoensis TaxID=53368 RepID=UPI0012F77275|nr:hypothetical protein [Hamadaea tsunoensis]